MLSISPGHTPDTVTWARASDQLSSATLALRLVSKFGAVFWWPGQILAAAKAAGKQTLSKPSAKRAAVPGCEHQNQQAGACNEETLSMNKSDTRSKVHSGFALSAVMRNACKCVLKKGGQGALVQPRTESGFRDLARPEAHPPRPAKCEWEAGGCLASCSGGGQLLGGGLSDGAACPGHLGACLSCEASCMRCCSS